MSPYMIKDEAKFHTEAVRWIKYHKNELPKSFLMETKVVRRGKNRFPLSELSEKEVRLLLRAKHSSVIQTHSDLGGMGTNCDGSVISGGGLVFLKWMTPATKEFYIIDIDKLVNLKQKSITQQEAKAMADVVGVLK